MKLTLDQNNKDEYPSEHIIVAATPRLQKKICFRKSIFWRYFGPEDQQINKGAGVLSAAAFQWL